MSEPFPMVPLLVPGDRPDLFDKARTSGSDALVLNLGNGIDPQRKAVARNAVSTHAITNIPVWVLVNAHESPWFADDIAALNGSSPHAIVLERTEHAEQVYAVTRAFHRVVPLVPLIESVEGIENLPSILRVEGVIGAAFDPLNYAFDLGTEASWDALLSARSEIVLRSRSAGLPKPLDGINPMIDDYDLAKHDAAAVAKIGFGGKIATHPRQVSAYISAFTPDPRPINWVRRAGAPHKNSAPYGSGRP